MIIGFDYFAEGYILALLILLIKKLLGYDSFNIGLIKY